MMLAVDVFSTYLIVYVTVCGVLICYFNCNPPWGFKRVGLWFWLFFFLTPNTRNIESVKTRTHICNNNLYLRIVDNSKFNNNKLIQLVGLGSLSTSEIGSQVW